MRRYGYAILLLLMPVAIGCGDKVPVSGKVVFTDGTPVPLVSVLFESEDGMKSAVGRTDEQGNFEMMFETPGDGVPRGAYRVSLRRPHPMDLDPGQEKLSPGPGWGLQKKYRSPASSGITYNIERKVTDIKIELEKNARSTKQ